MIKVLELWILPLEDGADDPDDFGDVLQVGVGHA
jgi:hypothetical protein